MTTETRECGCIMKKVKGLFGNEMWQIIKPCKIHVVFRGIKLVGDRYA